MSGFLRFDGPDPYELFGAQLTAMLSQLVISWITNVVVPSGSSIVKIAA